MKEYLKGFTVRAITATRTGDLERQQIQAELEELIASRPDNAAQEMVAYLEFLHAVVTGAETELLWEGLPENLQEIFGEVMRSLKETEIFALLKDLTKKTVAAADQEGPEKDAVLRELEAILSSQPGEASKEMVRYLTFLMAVASGDDIEELFPMLDRKLAGIYREVMEERARGDMLEFFRTLTEAAVTESRQGPQAGRVSVSQVIDEMLDPESPPPPAIRNYLELLLSLVEGNYDDTKRKDIPAMFLEILDGVRKTH